MKLRLVRLLFSVFITLAFIWDKLKIAAKCIGVGIAFGICAPVILLSLAVLLIKGITRFLASLADSMDILFYSLADNRKLMFGISILAWLAVAFWWVS